MFSEATKQKALTYLQTGHAVKATCIRYHIKSRSTLLKWKQEAFAPVGWQPTNREVWLLQHEVERLRIDNEILRLAGCSEISPIEVRKEAFSRLVADYPLNRLCRILAITRGSAHYLRDHKVKVTQLEIQDEKLRKLIAAAFEESHKTYGKRRIKAELNEMGVVVSEAHIARLMRELHLKSKHTTYRYEPFRGNPVYYANRLRQNFKAEAPNLKWTTDCTFIRGNGVWYFACAIIDLFARRVVGWGVSEEKTGKFVADIFKHAFFERGNPKNLLFHSDQGAEFIEFLLKQWARQHNVILSYSRAGNPHDNAVSESFFATMKKEWIYNRIYSSSEELHNHLKEGIEWYNSKRRHSANGNKSPCQAELEFTDGCVKILD